MSAQLQWKVALSSAWQSLQDGLSQYENSVEVASRQVDDVRTHWTHQPFSMSSASSYKFFFSNSVELVSLHLNRHDLDCRGMKYCRPRLFFLEVPFPSLREPGCFTECHRTYSIRPRNCVH